MKKVLVSLATLAFVALVGCSGVAEAATSSKLSVNTVGEAGFNNLTAEQQAQIIQSITAAQSKETSTIDDVDKWVNVGERIGKMVGGAAREVGVAANEFVKTDVGRMTAALIIWNYMGEDLVHIFVHVGGGMMFIVLGLSSVFFILRRTHPIATVYDPNSRTWYGASRVVSEKRAELSVEVTAFTLISCGIVLGIGMAIMLNV